MTDSPPPAEAQFFGHPRGLATLYFTEMWERFSFYGMRALLILFMTASVERGGLGFTDSKSGAIYGLYTAMVYMVSLPGGWIADRILGQRKSVLYGGIVIACGHFCMALPGLTQFYIGLGLICIGTGLLKPNVSTMVGALYAPDDNRRDAGFSIFYMGINLGAFLSPLACGYVGEKIDWHYGFGLAGIGMTIGLIQYVMGAKHLGTAGLYPAPSESPAAAAKLKRNLLLGIGVAVAVIALMTVLPVTAQGVSDAGGFLLLVVTFATFAWLIFFADSTSLERKRFVVIFVLFLAASLFWSAFEQAGSTLNLFAERSTAKLILGFEYPASWFQSVNSLFIISLAPVLAWLWMRMGTREPSIPAKFSLALIFVGLGFLVMIGGALAAANGVQVSSVYLWVCYLLHTIGELCLSPVGLSAMTKLAPARFVGLMMGIWFLATAVGNYIGGRLASVYGSFGVPSLFGIVAAFCIVLGLILAAMVNPIKKLMGGVK